MMVVPSLLMVNVVSPTERVPDPSTSKMGVASNFVGLTRIYGFSPISTVTSPLSAKMLLFPSKVLTCVGVRVTSIGVAS